MGLRARVSFYTPLPDCHPANTAGADPGGHTPLFSATDRNKWNNGIVIGGKSGALFWCHWYIFLKGHEFTLSSLKEVEKGLFQPPSFTEDFLRTALHLGSAPIGRASLTCRKCSALLHTSVDTECHSEKDSCCLQLQLRLANLHCKRTD